MEPIKLAEVAAIVDGRIVGEQQWSVSKVVHHHDDIRSREQRALFVAIRTGHDHVKEAFANGAAAALVDHQITGVKGSGSQIIVNDTVEALHLLATYYRLQFETCEVVGVTGSVGKTTTKEMLRLVLGSRDDDVLATVGNLNNEVGLPLTVLDLERWHWAAVFEMAMRHRGEIRQLAKIARPKIGVITRIGLEHVGVLGSRDAIFEAKAELLDELPPKGFAVLNEDDDYFSRLRNRCRGGYVTFGETPGADYQISDLRYDHPDRQTFRIRDVEFTTRAIGRHQALNAAAAVAVAHRLGIPLDEIADRLSGFTAYDRRGPRRPGKDDTLVIDETVSASPDSVCAALEVLGLYAKHRSGRAVAVLGNMEELGAYESSSYRLVGEAVDREHVRLLVTVGSGAREIIDAVTTVPPSCRIACKDADDVINQIGDRLQHGDTVLVKGARDLGLEKVVDALTLPERPMRRTK